MLPLPLDQEHANKSRPSLDKVRELIGADESVKIDFVSDIPCLYQGWEGDEWAYVVRDDAMNRYLLMSNHGKWYVGDQQELRDLVKLYATVSQVAIKGLIELTEGRQQEEHRLRAKAASSLNLTIGQEELEANPALDQAVNSLIDAVQKDLKERGKKDGKA